MQEKQKELETLCQERESKRRIEMIAAGILRKNYKFVRQLEEMEAQGKELFKRMTHVKEQMKAVEERIALDKFITRYRVTVSSTLSNSRAASISRTLSFLSQGRFSSSLVSLSTTLKWKRIGN